MKLFIAILLLSAVAQASDKIQVDLCYESLCPGCGQFITTNLGPSLDKGLLDMVDFTFVPFGNAEESKQGDQWVFTCQHGAEECSGNTLTNCVMDQISDSMTKTKAVICIEQIANVNGQGFATALRQCSAQYKFDSSAVTTCMGNAHGNALQHAAAIRTPSDHQYVPWVVVNGSHPASDDDILDDIFSWACKNYTGSNKPAGCATKLSIKQKLCMNKSVENQIRSLSSQITAEN